MDPTDTPLAAGEFQITKDKDGARIVAKSYGKISSVQVIPAKDNAKVTAFHRNGLKFPSGQHVRYLVAELNGVRAYVNGEDGTVILSDKDLYP